MEAAKNEFIRQYDVAEGIQLDPAKVEFNGGLRSLAKLMLNSLYAKPFRSSHDSYMLFLRFRWGKFGQRQNLPSQISFTDPAAFFKFVLDAENEILEVHTYGPLAVVKYRKEEHFVCESSITNVVIAAYTTAQARLKLYSEIEKLNDR